MDFGAQPAQKCNIGEKQRVHADAKAENTSGPHDVGRSSAASHHMLAAPPATATMW